MFSDTVMCSAISSPALYFLYQCLYLPWQYHLKYLIFNVPFATLPPPLIPELNIEFSMLFSLCQSSIRNLNSVIIFFSWRGVHAHPELLSRPACFTFHNSIYSFIQVLLSMFSPLLTRLLCLQLITVVALVLAHLEMHPLHSVNQGFRS